MNSGKYTSDATIAQLAFLLLHVGLPHPRHDCSEEQIVFALSGLVMLMKCTLFTYLIWQHVLSAPG